MFLKILIIGGGLYYLYTRFVGQFKIPGAQDEAQINDQANEDDGEFVDYEEVD